jgi:hypothetical protein
MTRAKRWAVTLGVLALAAAPAGAQVPGVGLELVPKVGFYTAAADLEAATSAAGEIVDDRGGSLALGLAVDFGVALMPVSFRVGFDYVSGSEFTYADTTGADLEATGEQTMLALAGDIVLRPLPRLVIVQPYLLAGAGVKRYDFEFSEVDTGSDAEEVFPDSQTDFTLHAGLGLDLGLGPIALVAEVSDYVSWYEAEGGEGTELQNDLFLMAGIRIGLF